MVDKGKGSIYVITKSFVNHIADNKVAYVQSGGKCIDIHLVTNYHKP